ncbi:uncharacterized protein BDR25DRAFT_360844 [Lindgomyces ingoldianus]|uniref:Uncharacterized protein n=1 Tax=Lindgomyces ingoldianus TaxID=673940 RepID=A0ACB6QE85_9PLEO|nr:uncharacterized protein BDR25DRAFT_360844 [Lindgomyces ingoldianus]KAF2465206.1 hypothetical protein BDR25DRAFT_360844 [Lindgomyces ingoldianus]
MVLRCDKNWVVGWIVYCCERAKTDARAPRVLDRPPVFLQGKHCLLIYYYKKCAFLYKGKEVKRDPLQENHEFFRPTSGLRKYSKRTLNFVSKFCSFASRGRRIDFEEILVYLHNDGQLVIAAVPSMQNVSKYEPLFRERENVEKKHRSRSKVRLNLISSISRLTISEHPSSMPCLPSQLLKFRYDFTHPEPKKSDAPKRVSHSGSPASVLNSEYVALWLQPTKVVSLSPSNFVDPYECARIVVGVGQEATVIPPNYPYYTAVLSTYPCHGVKVPRQGRVIAIEVFVDTIYVKVTERVFIRLPFGGNTATEAIRSILRQGNVERLNVEYRNQWGDSRSNQELAELYLSAGTTQSKTLWVYRVLTSLHVHGHDVWILTSPGSHEDLSPNASLAPSYYVQSGSFEINGVVLLGPIYSLNSEVIECLAKCKGGTICTILIRNLGILVSIFKDKGLENVKKAELSNCPSCCGYSYFAGLNISNNGLLGHGRCGLFISSQYIFVICFVSHLIAVIGLAGKLAEAPSEPLLPDTVNFVEERVQAKQAPYEQSQLDILRTIDRRRSYTTRPKHFCREPRLYVQLIISDMLMGIQNAGLKLHFSIPSPSSKTSFYQIHSTTKSVVHFEGSKVNTSTPIRGHLSNSMRDRYDSGRGLFLFAFVLNLSHGFARSIIFVDALW